MAVENIYGKSAVDATRKNALPPYLDKVFESGVGGGGSEVFIINATLELINWTNSTNSLAVEKEISDDAQVIVFSQEENQTEYSVAGITCTAGAYDSVTGFTTFSFSCTSTPTIDLKIYMLIISNKSVD